MSEPLLFYSILFVIPLLHVPYVSTPVSVDVEWYAVVRRVGEHRLGLPWDRGVSRPPPLWVCHFEKF